MKYCEAISESIVSAMELDDRVLLLGEGVTDEKGVFGTCLDAHKRFPDRVIETPLSETMLTGALLGMAMEGYKPIYVHARADFSLFSYEHLINTIAKYQFLHLHKSCPITVRMIVGRGWGQGPNHSQSFAGHLANVPGLNVYMPVTSQSYLELFTTDKLDSPRIFIEPRRLFETELAPHKNFWADINVITVGDCYIDAVEAAKKLETVPMYSGGPCVTARVIPLERINGCSLWEEDLEHITEHPVLVVETSHQPFGIAAEVLAGLFPLMKGLPKMKRLAPPFTPLPVSQVLEAAWYPSAMDIVRAACELLGREAPPSHKVGTESFRGPF